METQRAYVASRFGEEAAVRFDAIEGKEQTWENRYAEYRRAAESILRQPGLESTERMRQIEVLGENAFTAENERVRARNLDTLPAQQLYALILHPADSPARPWRRHRARDRLH